MKKNLLSIMAMIMAVGGAFGADDVSKRERRCLKHPDKYVWVQNTQACIPINPCFEDNNAYCLDRLFQTLPSEESLAKQIINKYVENVLHDSVSEVKYLHIIDDGAADAGRADIGVKTFNGDYFVLMTYRIPVEVYREERSMYALDWAFIVFGYGEQPPIATVNNGSVGIFEKVKDINECKEIADFVRMITGKEIKYYIGSAQTYTTFKDGYGVCNIFEP